MRGYEFTERGKIVIALIIAIPLFLIAIALAVIAWNNSQPPDTPPSHNETPLPTENPEISEEPLPDGSGFNPTEEPDPGAGEQGEFDPEPTPDPPEEEPDETIVYIDLSEGIMLFQYSPESHDSLDDFTVSFINEFLTSPKNTDDTQIVIEMPQLPEDEQSALISAVISAFAQHDIPPEALSYSIYHANPDVASFEVKFFFHSVENRK